MRQTHLLLLLVLVLIIGGFAIWMAVQPGPPPANAGGDNAAPAVAPTIVVSRGSHPRQDTPGPESSLPADQPATDQPANDKPEDGYVVRGRVTFDDNVKLILPFIGDLAEYSVLIGCYPRGVKQPDTNEMCTQLKKDHSFEHQFSKQELWFEPEVAISALDWCVTMDVLNEPWLTTWDDNDELIVPKGGVAAVASIDGGIIDLGTITIGMDTFAREQWVFTGRLVHSSGRTLRCTGGHELAMEGDDGDSEDGYRSYEAFGTNEDGRFICVEYQPEGADPARCRVTICLDDDNSDLAEANEVRIKELKITGNLIDCGDVKVGGSLLEVVAKMDPAPPAMLNKDGRLAIDMEGSYHGPMAVLSLWCGDLSFDEGVPPAPHHVVMWIPEGIYEYHADAQYKDNYYLAVQGRIAVADNAVVKLELDLKAAATVPVRVLLPDGTQATPGLMSWYIRENGGIEHGRADTASWRVPVKADLPTEVVAEVPGYESVKGYANLGDAELVLKLDKEKALANPDYGVRVKLPALPEGMNPVSFPARLIVSNTEFTAQLNVTLQSGETQEVDVAVKLPGKYSVALHGGEGWGYPTTLLSGPIEADVVKGPFHDVELPPIAEPPWARRVEHVFAQLFVGGQRVDLTGPFLAADGSPLGQLKLRDQFALKTDALPMYLLEGDQRIPLTYSPPEKGGSEGILTLELPARVDVRLTRRGIAHEAFNAEITLKAEDSEVVHKCEAKTSNGTALLWAPEGKARVEVAVGGITLSREVTIVAGALKRVEFTWDRVAVTFNQTEPDSQPRDALLWRILRYDAEGRINPTWSDELWYSELKYMDVGRYRLLPAAGGKPDLGFDLDLTDGKDRTIELPSQAGAVAAKVRLSLPDVLAKELAHESEIDLSGMSMSDPESLRLSRFTDRFTEHFSAREAPGGVLVTGLFVGADVCLQGVITLYRDDEEIMWLLKPFRLRVTGADMTVKVQWSRAVPLHEHWDMVYLRYASLVDGCLVPLEPHYGALPGSHEVLFITGGEIIHREWITFAGDKPMRLPQTVINVFVEKELAQPQDFEETEDED